MNNRLKSLRARRRVLQAAGGAAFVVILVGGWLSPWFGYFIPLCMVLGIGVGFFRGRKWCDWYCPRGSFLDGFVQRVSPGKGIPPFFRRPAVRVGVLAFLMAMMTAQIIHRWPDPAAIGGFFVILLTVTTALGLVLALFRQQRTWCMICPIGTMTNWAGRGKYPLKIDSPRCVDCGLCARVCPVEISPPSFRSGGVETVSDGDCLKCSLCVAACPKQALRLPGKAA